MLTTIERQREADFRRLPILRDYVATMLEDLQFTEADEACGEGREERDTGTIYTLPGETFARCLADVERFASECAADIEAAQELVPGEEGLRYAHGRYMDSDRIGSTLWLARAGSGVTFTDDGNAPCLERLAEWARANSIESPYFGDDGKVYF